jgi:hypothetical protein
VIESGMIMEKSMIVITSRTLSSDITKLISKTLQILKSIEIAYLMCLEYAIHIFMLVDQVAILNVKTSW